MEMPIENLILDKISGEWGESYADEGDGVKVIRTANFTNHGKINFDNIAYRSIDSQKITKKKLLKGDIIIEKSGGSPTQPVGRVVFFDLDTEENYLCNNFTTILRPNSQKVYPKYLFYQLFIGHQRGNTLKYQNKTTGIINLRLDDYLKEGVRVPTIPEQIQITTVLSKIENAIHLRKQSISLLADLINGIFFEMFGNPVKNEKGWKKFPLNRFGDIITGNTPSRDIPEYYSDNFIEWIKTDDINHDDLYVAQSSEFLSEAGLQKSRFVEKDALLVACIAGSIASIGRAALTDRKVSFNQQINAIQPNPDVNSLFLYWQFRNSKQYIQSHAAKGMKKILTKGEFAKILMIKPPHETQEKFASIVQKIYTLKSKYQQSLSELETLFNSLCQKAYKNELDLTKVSLMYEEEYSSTDNDRTEPKPINFDKVTIEIPKIPRAKKDNSRFKEYGDPFDIDEATAKKQGKVFYKQWKDVHSPKLLKKEKITWENVNSQQVADWIKDKYTGYHFSPEMLMNYLANEHVVFPAYYSSEELKKYPHLNGAEDIKSFVFTAVRNVKMDEETERTANPFIKLEQHFYDAEKENFQLNVTHEDYELLRVRDKRSRSGIYFSIVEE